MKDVFKTLLDSKIINEDTQREIVEAWESKLVETREEIRSELREEFAQKNSHDKDVMVKALNKMVSEGLENEIREFKEEKSALSEDRVKFQKTMMGHATKFNNFMVVKLSEEIKQLREDRVNQASALNEVQTFVAKKLAGEIREFAIDKRDLVESKVKLVAEAKIQLDTLKKRFINESAIKVQNHVKKTLKSEMTTLHEDIQTALDNSFGRKIFEAFAGEFSTSHLNENAEIRKLKKLIHKKNKSLKESKIKEAKFKTLTESKEKQIRMIKESSKREEILTDLLGPLNKDKKKIMSNLLENVATKRLENTFEKYLPAVLTNNTKVPGKKRMVTESRREVTGDRSVKTGKAAEKSDSLIADITKLAGV